VLRFVFVCFLPTITSSGPFPSFFSSLILTFVLNMVRCFMEKHPLRYILSLTAIVDIITVVPVFVGLGIGAYPPSTAASKSSEMFMKVFYFFFQTSIHSSFYIFLSNLIQSSFFIL